MKVLGAPLGICLAFKYQVEDSHELMLAGAFADIVGWQVSDFLRLAGS